MQQLKDKKVIFYTSLPRLFRTTLIGYLYEIAQIYPTVLLSEKLDKETENILSRKDLFPNLKKIIPVRQYTDKRWVLSLFKNRELKNKAKQIIREEKPDIVILQNDFYFFEMCLLRYAKKSLKICFRACFQLGPKKEERLWSVLKNTYEMLSFIPLFLRKALVKLKKRFAHFIYYIFLPIIIFEKPFLGKSSCFLTTDIAGLREADFSTALSKRDYDLLVAEGLPKEKLYILPHPLQLDSREFFKRNYSLKDNLSYNKVITLMYSGQGLGIRKKDNSLISRKEHEQTMIRIISLLAKEFLDWKIFVKPHPVMNNFEELVKSFESISSNIKVTQPLEPADKYIEKSKVVVGVAPSSNSLFTACLQNPDKVILSLDFNKELLGDSFRDFEGIEYIDDEEHFLHAIKKIKNNNYKKKYSAEKNRGFFNSSVELINYADNIRSSKAL